jgi:DNA-directed RNA polymerase subunit RPC12/RpoP
VYVTVTQQQHDFKYSVLQRKLTDIICSTRGGEIMVKCGLCGAEVSEQPKITAQGKCSVCGAKLAIKK